MAPYRKMMPLDEGPDQADANSTKRPLVWTYVWLSVAVVLVIFCVAGAPLWLMLAYAYIQSSGQSAMASEDREKASSALQRASILRAELNEEREKQLADKARPKDHETKLRESERQLAREMLDVGVHFRATNYPELQFAVLEQARDFFEELIALDPNDERNKNSLVECLYCLGSRYRDEGRQDESEGAYRRANEVMQR
jgi:tetratricopeptide (TPR) repeat protein